MSLATAVMGLLQAVGGDNTPTYLKTALANSLLILDGHSHGGGASGNPITGVGGHVTRNGSAPTLAASTNAGAGPPVPIITPGSTDFAGGGTFGSGTGPSAGYQVDVTFQSAYARTNPPIVVANIAGAVSAGVLGAVGIRLNGAAGNWTGFSIATEHAPAANQANTTYGFYYIVVGG